MIDLLFDDISSSDTGAVFWLFLTYKSSNNFKSIICIFGPQNQLFDKFQSCGSGYKSFSHPVGHHSWDNEAASNTGGLNWLWLVGINLLNLVPPIPTALRLGLSFNFILNLLKPHLVVSVSPGISVGHYGAASFPGIDAVLLHDGALVIIREETPRKDHD